MMIRLVDIFKNQSGVALVIALIMMIVMTVIVLAASFTSIFEIKLAGNKRGSTDAFFAADSGVHVVTSDRSNFNIAGNFDENQKYYYSNRTSNLNPTKADITVIHDPIRFDCPRGFPMGLYVDCKHYMIESTGQDQVEIAPIRSTVTIHEKVVVPAPKISDEEER